MRINAIIRNDERGASGILAKGESGELTGTTASSPIRTCSRTDRGARPENEDACGIWEIPCKEGPLILLAVADGLGGHPAGEVASRMAVDSLHAYVRMTAERGPVTEPSDLEALMAAGMAAANRDILARAADSRACHGMGTTLVAALLNPMGEGVIGNVGDSRAYFVDDSITRITSDHSRVQEMVELGLLSREEADHHPLSNIVTRILGREGDHPDLYRIRLESRILLLCSDGLNDGLTDPEILSLCQGKDPDEICRDLVEHAWENGRDNITVVVAKRG
ncbi:MAG: protein phosphatase 2C domain-containing protein [Methanolinea sp.]|nr:protein phosphatase 2C domain-containing protein [Methanolinea sp.]